MYFGESRVRTRNPTGKKDKDLRGISQKDAPDVHHAKVLNIIDHRCKLKPQWDATLHPLGRLKGKGWKVPRVDEKVIRKKLSYVAGRNTK